MGGGGVGGEKYERERKGKEKKKKWKKGGERGKEEGKNPKNKQPRPWFQPRSSNVVINCLNFLLHYVGIYYIINLIYYFN